MRKRWRKEKECVLDWGGKGKNERRRGGRAVAKKQGEESHTQTREREEAGKGGPMEAGRK